MWLPVERVGSLGNYLASAAALSAAVTGKEADGSHRRQSMR
jgi:hypothetical protein